MRLLSYLWEGFAAMIIAVGTALMSMQHYPTDSWQFVIIGCGGLIAFVKAVDARRRQPLP